MDLKKNLAILLIALLISVGVWLSSPELKEATEERVLQATPSYTTNPDRHESVNTVCAGKDRNSMVSAESASQADAYKAEMASQFTLDS